MWNLFDQWLVVVSLMWAVWVIYRKLSKKSYLSCEKPCSKKIFDQKSELLTIKRKLRAETTVF